MFWSVDGMVNVFCALIWYHGKRWESYLGWSWIVDHCVCLLKEKLSNADCQSCLFMVSMLFFRLSLLVVWSIAACRGLVEGRGGMVGMVWPTMVGIVGIENGQLYQSSASLDNYAETFSNILVAIRSLPNPSHFPIDRSFLVLFLFCLPQYRFSWSLFSKVGNLFLRNQHEANTRMGSTVCFPRISKISEIKHLKRKGKGGDSLQFELMMRWYGGWLLHFLSPLSWIYWWYDNMMTMR